MPPSLAAEHVARFLGTANFRSSEDAARWVAELPALNPEQVLACVAAVNVAVHEAAPHHLRALAVARIVERSGDTRLFTPLVRQLRSCEPELRNTLVSALPKVNDPAAHGEVCALLRHPDGAVRSAAAMLIARVGGKTALAILAEMLRERNFAARTLVIEAAVRIGGHHAIGPLTGALPVCTPPEKLKIIRLLGDETFMSRDRTGALSALATLLCEPDTMVLAAATQSFARLATEAEWFDYASPALDSAHPTVVMSAIQSLRRFPSRRSVDALHRKLRSGPKVVRLEVLAALESFGTDDVLPPLVEALGHRQLEVRTRAAEVLANLSAAGKIEIARTVLWLLRSGEADARRMAVEVARKAKDPVQEVWPRLFAYLRDEDWWVRERVSDALIEIAGEKLLPYVMGFLADPDVAVRMFGVETVRRLTAAQALGALVKTAQNDADWWVRERAVEAIAAIGDPRAAPWLADLSLREPRMAVP
jgi:HEAT repeat protein